MDKVKIFKALGNETRLNILLWLKEPQKNFEPQIHLSIMDDFQEGVCVGTIRKKSRIKSINYIRFFINPRRGRACRIKKYWAIYLF